ncbi:unnamed protein product [Sphagnum balticum]
MEKERRRGGPVDNLRDDDPETANPAGVDVVKQRLGVRWRPETTTGLTQERKQIIREKLHLAFLKKQVKKLKSSAKGTHMQQPNS